jgi:hypothetical protein
VADGPYVVYRSTGTVIRLGIPPTTLRAGGPLADPVHTEDGTLWLRRIDTGAICSLRDGADRLDCQIATPDGHRGALTVIQNAPGLPRHHR